MPITAVGSGMCHRVNDARGKRRLRGDLVDGGLVILEAKVLLLNEDVY